MLFNKAMTVMLKFEHPYAISLKCNKQFQRTFMDVQDPKLFPEWMMWTLKLYLRVNIHGALKAMNVVVIYLQNIH